MGLFTNGKCKSKARLDGKTAIITGANTGIGYETALELVRRGARVILACRSTERAEGAAKKLRDAITGAQVRIVSLDLASLRSVKSCADEILLSETAIHLLINNAGVMMCPYERTEDGLEMQFQSNHLGHFLFTLLLLPRLKASAPARIVNLSSYAHKFGKINFNDLQSTKSYSPTGAYGQSKLCNILFTLELQKRLQGSGVVAYAVHPGAVSTELQRHLPSCLTWTSAHVSGSLFKTPKQGAQTTLQCAIDEKLAVQCGLYFSDCKEETPTKRARKPGDASKLWDVSEELVSAYLPPTPVT
ncbi:hypothetical protein B566_EDAN004877 [Ephemera danica]|nr:hypothetical protein B566_EDAN004877 [Ephemera danica]